MRRSFALAAAVLLVACDGGGARLVVDLRTDYVAGEEVARAELSVEGVTEPRTMAFAAGADLAAGARVAELDGLERGARNIDLRLFAPDGRVVATRAAIVTLERSTVATLLVTRNCEGVVCSDPAAPACIDARCVPAGCIAEDIEACGEEATCDRTSCEPTVACADADCVAGFCLEMPVSDRCGPDEFCHSNLGCQPRMTAADAGPGDAGATDAGATDAGGVDAGTDAGPGDAGSVASCVDALEPNESADAAADDTVVSDFQIGSMYSEPGLTLCAGDEDWIGLQTLGVVQIRGTLTPSLPMGGAATVCVELFTWSELRRVVADPPISQGMVCGPATMPLTLGPVTGTLDGGPNYLLVHVTVSGGSLVDYDLVLTGSLT